MRYWLGLGANLGDPRASIEAALARLGELARVEAVSHPWQTAPREVEDQPVFLNAGARVASDLDPRALLAAVKDLERALGRDPGGVRFGPRAIDCDLLLWEGGEWEDDVLTIPHRTGALAIRVTSVDEDEKLVSTIGFEELAQGASTPLMYFRQGYQGTGIFSPFVTNTFGSVGA